MNLSFRFGGKEFQDAGVGLEYAADQMLAAWEGQVTTVKLVMRDYLTSVAQELAARHGSPWPGGTSANTLSRRSGRLTDSILRSVKVTGGAWDSLRGSIGGNAYAGLHERGGVVKAKGKLLTIPLPAALNGRGVAPLFARQWSNTFVARSKAGNLIIFQKRGDDIVPLYVLKSEVYIPPRLGMARELQTQLPYFLTKAVDRVADDFMVQVR